MEGAHVFRLGFWSAFLFTLTGILYGVSMGLLLSNYSIPDYVELEQFLRAVPKEFMDFYSFSQFFAFLSTLFYIILLCCIHDSVEEKRKIYSRLSLLFGLAFVLLACINYFLQFSIVRLSLNEGITANLEPFVQLNPRSFAFAINMLGWSLFLGLSTFFIGMVYKSKAVIRWTFFLTSGFCILGFIGFIVDHQWLMLIFQIGMTVGLTIGGAMISVFFYKEKVN